jgi:hypothetical protein
MKTIQYLLFFRISLKSNLERIFKSDLKTQINIPYTGVHKMNVEFDEGFVKEFY